MSEKEITITGKPFPWKKTDKRLICFLDIMGFKDMVARQSHRSIYKMMKKVSKSVRSVESVFSLGSDDDSPHITMMLFSDSIMIFSKDKSGECIDNFFGAISTLAESLFKEGIPFKGAIAFGKLTLDFNNSIFFGQPLIDAFLLQEELKYYGIAIHASVENSIPDISKDESVIEYECHFKTGVAKHLTVVPGVFISDEYDEETMTNLKTSVNKLKLKTSGALRKYIDNTLNYLEYVEKRGELMIK